MRKLTWRDIDKGVFLILIVTAAVLACGVGILISHKVSAAPGSWPAWIQAFGSIGAIAGSYWLGERAFVRERKARASDQRMKQIQDLNALIAAVVMSKNRVGSLCVFLQSDERELKRSHVLDLVDCIGVLREAASSIKQSAGVWAFVMRLATNLRRTADAVNNAQMAPEEVRLEISRQALAQANQYLEKATETIAIVRAAINSNGRPG